MILGVVGSREEISENIVRASLNMMKSKIDKVITGGARGVDTYAINWCKENNIHYEVIRPINETIKINYLYRNIEIITMCDRLLIFWNGKSKGTEFVINYAEKRNKLFKVVSDLKGEK